MAQCRECGNELFFKQGYFDVAPDDMSRGFIAHESAHATWSARGEPAHVAGAADISPDIDSQQDEIGKTCERLANQLTEEWGFRQTWLD